MSFLCVDAAREQRAWSRPPAAVAVKAESPFSVGPPRTLLAGNYSAFDIARDGRILVIGNPDASASPGRLNVVVNWFEEIRTR